MRCIRAAHLSSSGLGGSTRVDRVKRLTGNITKYGVHTHGLRDTRPSGPRGSSGAPSVRTPAAGPPAATADASRDSCPTAFAKGSRSEGRAAGIRSPSLRVLGIIARPVSGYPVWTVRADAPSARARRAGVGSCPVPRVVPDQARSRRQARHQLELPATHRHLLNLIHTDIMLCSVPCTAVWIRPLPARLSASGSVTRRWECCIRTRARQPCYCHWQCHSQLPMAAAQGRPGCDRSRQPRRP